MLYRAFIRFSFLFRELFSPPWALRLALHPTWAQGGGMEAIALAVLAQWMHFEQ